LFVTAVYPFFVFVLVFFRILIYYYYYYYYYISTPPKQLSRVETASLLTRPWLLPNTSAPTTRARGEEQKWPVESIEASVVLMHCPHLKVRVLGFELRRHLVHVYVVGGQTWASKHRQDSHIQVNCACVFILYPCYTCSQNILRSIAPNTREEKRSTKKRGEIKGGEQGRLAAYLPCRPHRCRPRRMPRRSRSGGSTSWYRPAPGGRTWTEACRRDKQRTE